MKLIIPSTVSSQSPKNYFILLDNSGSMSGSISELKETVLAIKESITERDTVSIGYFSSFGDYNWICKGASLYNADITKAIEANIKARGLTNFNQILSDVEKTVNDVVLLTGNDECVFNFASDGYPNDRSPEKETYDICEKISSLFISKTVIGYGSYYNREVLLKMAESLKGSFVHVSDCRELKRANETIFKSGQQLKQVSIDQKYDLVWQVVGTDVKLLEQKSDNSVVILEQEETDNILFAVNFSELDSVELDMPAFVYSLAYILSIINKPNLGVVALKRAGDGNVASILQKAFTTANKGKAENVVKSKITDKEIIRSHSRNKKKLSEFLNQIESNNYYIDLTNSKFPKTSHASIDIANVKFVKANEPAKIVGITTNENRPNISFNTVQHGEIVEILNDDLNDRIKEYNLKCVDGKNKIELPIKTTSFKNYSFVANGDFNCKKLSLIGKIGNEYAQVQSFIPEEEIEIFENKDEPLLASEFVDSYKTLIKTKAESSIINYILKSLGGLDSTHDRDLRKDLYGADAVALLGEMGLDSEMRYSSKKIRDTEKENIDYIPFLSITAQIKGAASINAKDIKQKLNEGKSNEGTKICAPIFEKYENLKKTVEIEKYVELLRDSLKANKKQVYAILEKLIETKFRMATTNAWFEDVEKTDKFELNGVVVNVKEEKEYL